MPILAHFHHEVAGERVHHARAHAVQAAGNLITLAIEFPARVQHREADLHRGAAHLGMDAHGKAAAIVLHGDGAILVQGDFDVRAIARQRLVHRVIHDFINQMVQAAFVRRADIHAGAVAHSLQPFEHLYLGLVVRNVIVIVHTRPRFKKYLLFYYTRFAHHNPEVLRILTPCAAGKNMV